MHLCACISCSKQTFADYSGLFSDFFTLVQTKDTQKNHFCLWHRLFIGVFQFNR